MAERLTYIDHIGWYVIGTDGKRLRGEHIDRLAACEDTGLEPEEINKLRVVSQNDKMMLDRIERIISELGSLNHLRDLLATEQDGRLAVLPCKVGDTVYKIFCHKVYPASVDRIIINRFTKPQIWIETKLEFSTPVIDRYDLVIGKTVFLTPEEAEAELAKESNYDD